MDYESTLTEVVSDELNNELNDLYLIFLHRISQLPHIKDIKKLNQNERVFIEFCKLVCEQSCSNTC